MATRFANAGADQPNSRYRIERSSEPWRRFRLLDPSFGRAQACRNRSWQVPSPERVAPPSSGRSGATPSQMREKVRPARRRRIFWCSVGSCVWESLPSSYLYQNTQPI
jgi:hypothetical protein